MAAFKIFIVEDDPWYGEVLKYHLSLNPDYEVFLFSEGNECLKNLYLNPDVITLDFHLPGTTGEALMAKIKAQNSAIPVVIISGQTDIATALDLMRKGAYDYLIKNDSTKELLWNIVIKIRENVSLKREVEELREQLEHKFDFERTIIGQSAVMRRMFTLIEKSIKTNINVSITGETGTGKEVVAKSIHLNSDRKKKPFVAVNMGAIPKELIESELFGHEKGAFTGALAQKKGKFEEANGGTIFLDEIAELDLNLQSKILRVIQEREIVRIGGNEVVKFDARLLTATHKDLGEEVRAGRFREDLYFRIMGLPIEIPPLRNRGNDVLILAKHFMELFVKENKLKPFSFSAAAKDKLMKYNFPGNVRELKAVIDLACVMCEGTELQAEDITFSSFRKDELFTSVEKTMREYTADIIQIFLNKYNNNVVEVANKLDIGKSSIYNMIKAGEVKLNK